MRKFIWILSAIVVFLIVGVGLYGWHVVSDLSEVVNTDEEDLRITIESFTIKENAHNPFGGRPTQENLSDAYYKDYIHKMSHQKIKADEKSGFYLMTEERIDWLLEGLEVATVVNKDVYLDILTRWKKGDFSQVDKDHNTVWSMKEGAIGEAYDILSPEEELAYIESQKGEQ